MRSQVLFGGCLRSARAFVSLCVALLLLGVLSAHARAEAQALAILGIGSDDDEVVAASLTDALRYEAQRDGSARISDTHVSLLQMTLAEDCDIEQVQCRTQIAKALDVEQVIYGVLRRKPSGGYEVDLHMFAAQGGETQAHRAIADGETGRVALRVHAHALLGALEGVFADDASNTDEMSGGARADAATPASEAPPADDASQGSNDWLGYTLLGVAGVSLGLTAFSWSQIHAAADDGDFKTYRMAVGQMKPSIRDVCDEAEGGRAYGVSAQTLANANSACSRGNTYERLQFVFVGAMLLSAGIGAYFLLDDDGSSEHARQDRTRFALEPSVTPHSAFLNARLSL